MASIKSLAKITTKFINYKQGGAENMFVDERTIEPQSNEYLIKVKAIGINRAECLHRQGKYAISKPVESFLGLEAAGQIIDPETNTKLFDGIALLSGGSYAQWAAVPKAHVMPLPKGFDYFEGAAIPEAWLTAFQIISLASLKAGESVVIYASASGVGTAALQICQILGFKAFSVVSSEEKGKICNELSAKGVAFYKDNKGWAQDLIKHNQGQRFDAVLDCVGQQNVTNTINLLKTDGRWVLYGLLSGPKTEMNLAALLGKRINLISTTLKTRSDKYKEDLINNFVKEIFSGFQSKKIKPIIHDRIKCDWSSADSFINSHKLMESNANSGKIVIEYL